MQSVLGTQSSTASKEASIAAPPDQYGTGTIWHRRAAPHPHAFQYKAWFSLLDVEQLEACFSKSSFWSLGRFNLVQFRRSDYIGPADIALGEAVRRRVEDALGFRPTGRVRMLTHLRQWGACFNPVTFYLCEEQGQLQALVAEIHNTPWGERHAYVLDARDQSGPEYRFQFEKRFHVSPFLPMQMGYDWRLRVEEDRFGIHMKVMDGERELFSAGLSLSLDELDAGAMRSLPIRHALMPQRVLAGIYWQALRLWLKQAPFHAHPGGLREPDAIEHNRSNSR